MTRPDDDGAGPVTAGTVAAAATLAGLPLDEGRAAAVAALLSAWIPDANALSTRMQAESLRPLMPATVFGQPPAAEGSET
ncbi:hypothetical protein [Actinomycetospora termitidis]|uniref:DUF4089 domain-containing protein n=1 Tax=Actinomycetospora termitidis TaxID=3053470 RepID=A0ABT7M5Y1_9PSEU|nr:hypothetical protein [Actinomycetospora sp. Odt1-22]MDL5156085.1 hypothetical protein [Actinomycetospora sp. Odt1-22]